MKTPLICALVLAASGLAQAAGAPSALSIPSSLALDGYCDGISGIVAIGGGLFTGTHDYTVCNENGGSYTNTTMAGPQGLKMFGASAGVAGVAGVDSSFAQFGASFLYVVENDGTWSLVVPELGGVVNSGTWTAGYPPAASRVMMGSKTSFQR